MIFHSTNTQATLQIVSVLGHRLQISLQRVTLPACRFVYLFDWCNLHIQFTSSFIEFGDLVGFCLKILCKNSEIHVKKEHFIGIVRAIMFVRMRSKFSSDKQSGKQPGKRSALRNITSEKSSCLKKYNSSPLMILMNWHSNSSFTRSYLELLPVFLPELFPSRSHCFDLSQSSLLSNLESFPPVCAV